jgi:hypothetical protein
MKKREKSRKWDGRSRISTDQYKKNWDDIFGNRNVVRTEASFISQDYGEDKTYENESSNSTITDNDGSRTDKVSPKK